MDMNSMARSEVLLSAFLAALVAALPGSAFAISNSFTYQGTLEDGGLPANGDYDLQFELQTGLGVPVGAPVLADDVAVIQGVFTVDLDFGTAITSGDFQLQIGVRPGASVGAFVALVPPTRIAPTPQAQVAALAVEAITVSPDSITSASISNGSIGAADVDASAIQRRVSPGCTASEAIRDVNADGSVSCVVVPAGTAGQAGVSVFGSSSLTVAPTSGQTTIPGLTTNISVPNAAVVYVSTNGGISTTSASSSGLSVVDIFLIVDGAIVANGGYQRVVAANTAGIANNTQAWSTSLVVPVSAGMHTIAVRALGVNVAGAVDATVSGNNTSANQGTLSVIVLKL